MAVVSLAVVLGAAVGMLLVKRHREEAEARYRDLVHQGIDSLEAGLLTAPIDREGEALSLGILQPAYPDWPLSGPEHAIKTFRKAAEVLPGRPEAYLKLKGVDRVDYVHDAVIVRIGRVEAVRRGF